MTELPEISEQTVELFRRAMKKLEPPPDYTLSEWADEYRYLSTESAPEPGRWRTDRAPYQREPMDAVTDPKTRKVVLMWGAQMGKTDCAIMNTVGYFMHYEPSPIMILEPTVEMAETISKNRLSPMLRDTPALSGLVAQKSRSGNNTIQEKQFPGGYVVMLGANSPASLASRPIRILAADEIDRYPPSAGKEGDPLLLAHKRTTAFWNSKEIVTSTPTIKGQSRIETEYQNSTQAIWEVPCPNCGRYQAITWAKIKFDEDGFREGTNREVLCECEHCGEVSREFEWKNQSQKGKYVHRYPKRKVKGFYANALSSTLTTWEEIVEDFLTAIDERMTGSVQALKTWTNTVLAETWDDEGSQMDTEDIEGRQEDYGAEVPEEVLYLTAGIDTQEDRLEYEIVGWGIGAESWGIEKGAIYGDLKQPEIYERMDAVLMKTWKKENGAEIGVTAACWDSQGHFAVQVQRFCKPRWNRNIWPIKGRGGFDVPYITNPSTSNRVKTPQFTIGVDTGKCIVMDRLQIEETGPGYCHFPIGRGYDALYFKGLTAEKKITTYKNGISTFKWVLREQGFRRNEPFDIRNYATAAMEIAHLPLWPKRETKKAARGRRQLSRGITE